MLAGLVDLQLVRQVQSRAAVATIQDDPHAHTLGQRLDDAGVQLVVGDLSRLLEVARDQRVVHTGRLVAVRVLDLSAMAAVVEEQLIPCDRLGSEPCQGRQDIFLGGHHVRAVVAEPADLIVLESEGVLQDADDGLRIVDAAGEPALPRLQAQVVAADRDRLAHRRPGRRDGRGNRGLDRHLAGLSLGHETSAEVDELFRGELGHLLEVLLLQELPHLLEHLVERARRLLRDHDLEGRSHGTRGLRVACQARACVRARLIVHAAGDHHNVALRRRQKSVHGHFLHVD
mmetsp:Transcript_25687/g.73327  ORF Transcript_25687/g.73327 Transcript_25687/m.73327 type:complete len:287 (-) Transcript_25687:173-1033(-)